MNRSIFRRYLLPGLVFQSIVIGGGYGTGRELVEFFLVKAEGPTGGLLAIGVSTAIFSVVSMVTFELARLWGAFDYRHFFQNLLGPGWRVFEGCYLGLLLIIIAVAAAAAQRPYSERSESGAAELGRGSGSGGCIARCATAHCAAPALTAVGTAGASRAIDGVSQQVLP